MTPEGTDTYTLLGAAWVLALGWAEAECRTRPQRLTVLAALLVGMGGYFADQPGHSIVVTAGVGGLLLVRSVRVPTALAHLARVVGGASLWVYLTHWQLYPRLEAAGHPWTAIAASLVVGVAVRWTYARVRSAIRSTTGGVSALYGCGERAGGRLRGLRARPRPAAGVAGLPADR